MGFHLQGTYVISGDAVAEREKVRQIVGALAELELAKVQMSSAARYEAEEGPIDPEGADRKVSQALERQRLALNALDRAKRETGLSAEYP